MKHINKNTIEGIDIVSVGRVVAAVLIFSFAFFASILLIMELSGPSLASLAFVMILAGSLMTIVHKVLNHFGL